MRLFTGQYDRTIDAKNRIQLPSQLRAVIDPERDGEGAYVTLGQSRGTLVLYTPRGFEELATRTGTGSMQGPEARRFELQFYGLASRVDIDKQGRFVLPDRLRKKAKLPDEIFLLGQMDRIEIWNRDDLDRALGIDWDGDDWPEWQGFVRGNPDRPTV